MDFSRNTQTTTADFAALVSLASEKNQPKPSRILIRKLRSSVSQDVQDVANAIETGSTDALYESQLEYLNVIKELAAN